MLIVSASAPDSTKSVGSRQSFQCVLFATRNLPRFRSDDADAHCKDCFELFCGVETASQHPAVCVRSRPWSDPVLQSPVVALVELDYGSATLAGLPAVQLDRLQSVLNAAARLIY